VAKTVNVDIDEEGNVSVDIIGAIDGTCKHVADAFKKIGKVTKDVKKPEYYKQPNQNVIKTGR
jgi:hypothetical protein